VRCSGDRRPEEPLGEQSPIGFFTKEIEEALLGGRIDLAVHSLKDLPTELPSGLTLAAMLQRDEPYDLLLVRPDAYEADRMVPVAAGAAVGASSRRRAALLKWYAPDLRAQPIRGNVDTRVEKVRRGDYAAILLSAAGVQRLRLQTEPLLVFALNPRRWPGAPGQSIIAVETRVGDGEALRRVSSLDHGPSRACAEVERALLVTFGGGCHAPFGAYATRSSGRADIFVAAPSSEGGLSVQHFQADDLGKAREQAVAWIRAGCPVQHRQEEEEWLCRPAPRWC
jgi:hydroxymethylbilane synthase